MTVGIGLGLSNYTFSSAGGYWDWVLMCDDEGVDSIWQTDRLVSREPFLECMSAMATLAGATKKVKFGMNVASLGIRDPLITAKECATIDYLSNGRLLPAFGLGSNRSRDWIASGRATKARGQRMNEALEIMTRLWSEEKVTFEGKHFQYTDATISPRPVQNPLPCWIGGSARAAVERTVNYGNGWQASFQSPEEAGKVVADIMQYAKEQGKHIDPDHMGIGFGVRFGSWDDPIVQQAASAFEKRSGRDPKTGMAVGDAEDILEMIWSYIPHGISKFILRPLGDGDEEMMAQSRRLIDEVLRTPRSSPNAISWQAKAASRHRWRPEKIRRSIGSHPLPEQKGTGDSPRNLPLAQDVGCCQKDMSRTKMTPRESAIKEAFEEAGINGKVPDKKVGDYVYHKDDKIDGTTYKVAVYAMRVTYELDIWPEDNQRKREWMSVEKAAHSVDEIELRQLILGFAETVKK